MASTGTAAAKTSMTLFDFSSISWDEQHAGEQDGQDEQERLPDAARSASGPDQGAGRASRVWLTDDGRAWLENAGMRALGDEQLQLAERSAVAVTAPIRCGCSNTAVEHRQDGRRTAMQAGARAARPDRLAASPVTELDERRPASASASGHARAIEQCKVGRTRRRRRRLAAWLPGDLRADAAENAAEQQREQGPEQEEQESLAQHRRGEVAAGDDEGGADQIASFAALLRVAHPRAAASPAMATKASCRPGRSMLRVSIPAPPSISALSSGSGRPAAARTPIRRRRIARCRGAPRHGPSVDRVRRRTIGRRRPRASSTRLRTPPCPSAMMAIRSQSRSAWAMTWVEKITVTPSVASARISSSSLSWLIASRPEKGSSRTIRRGRE